MRGRQSVSDLANESRCARKIHPRRLNQRAQISPGYVLHHQVGTAILEFPDVERSNDTRMIDLRKCSNFIFELLLEPGTIFAVAESFEQKLHYHGQIVEPPIARK